MLLFANNVATTLANSCLAGDGTIVVNSATGMPTLGTNDYFYLTLASPSTPETAWEVVKVTAIAGASLTVVRGQDGTTAQGWAAGTRAELRIPAQALEDIQASGSPVGGWTAYTPTWSGSITNPSIGNGTLAGRWRRVGECVEVVITMLSGTTTTYGSGTYTFGLPDGLVIDYSKINSTADAHGPCRVSTNSVLSVGTAQAATTTSLTAVMTQGSVGSAVPSSWTASAAGQLITIRAMLPIVGWGSNINLATDFQEFISCDGSAGVAANTTYTPTTTRGAQGSGFPSVAITSTTATTLTVYQLTTLNAIKPTDKLVLEISGDSGATWVPLTSGPPVANGIFWGGYTGMFINYAMTSGNTVAVAFSNAGRQQGGTYAAASAAWSDLSALTYRWRVRKISQGNFAQAGTDAYSTAETLTNKTWFNGKPIYRKVVSLGALPNNTTKTVAHGITGITWVTNLTITATDGTNFDVLPVVNSSTLAAGVGCWATSTDIAVMTGFNYSGFSSSYAVIEYTK